jgi:hypothetical protein
MHRHVIAHGDDPGLAVEDGAGVVAPLLDVGRESRAPQRRAHLLGNGMHRALKNRQFYGSKAALCHADSSDCNYEVAKAIYLRMQPGGNTVAEVYSVIIAGPWIPSPGARPSRR